MNMIQHMPQPENTVEAAMMMFEVQKWICNVIQPVLMRELMATAAMPPPKPVLSCSHVAACAHRSAELREAAPARVPCGFTPGGVPTQPVPQEKIYHPTPQVATATSAPVKPTQLALAGIQPAPEKPSRIKTKKVIVLPKPTDPEVSLDYMNLVKAKPASALACLHSVHFQGGVLPPGSRSSEFIQSGFIRFLRKNGAYKLYALTDKGLRTLNNAMMHGPKSFKVVNALKGYSVISSDR